jgi:hypothetical protein
MRIYELPHLLESTFSAPPVRRMLNRIYIRKSFDVTLARMLNELVSVPIRVATSLNCFCKCVIDQREKSDRIDCVHHAS